MIKSIDLSHIISEEMQVYPGTDKPVLKKVFGIEKDGFMESYLTLSTHTGTHIDAPAHLIHDGCTIDSFTFDTFFGSALKIDCRNLTVISPGHIKRGLSIDPIPDFILIFTGFDTYWGTEKYYGEFPVLDPHAAEYIASLPLKGIGTDALSFDPFGDNELKNHRILLKKNLILIENLCNLAELPDNEFLFGCYPLNIKGADGSPVRAAGILKL
jgi:arylformamidase